MDLRFYKWGVSIYIITMTKYTNKYCIPRKNRVASILLKNTTIIYIKYHFINRLIL